MFAQLGSIFGMAMFMWAIFKPYYPYFAYFSRRVFSFVNPYVHITFDEFTGERFARSEAFTAVECYLSANSSSQARRLKADVVKNNQSNVVLSMDDQEEVSLDFNGAKLRWMSGKMPVNGSKDADEKRLYKLCFHKRHRSVVMGSYLPHVLKEGRAIKVRNRQRKLYTNSGNYWSHVV